LANTRSAEKRNRQAQKRRARNVQVRTTLKTAVKKAREAIAKGEATAREAIQGAVRALDKAASRGIVHRNAAARRIARMAKAATKAAKAAPSATK
jgi:small subunit ribosomal protein S20